MKISRFSPLLFWLALITILSLMPGNDLPHRGLFGIPHLDKVVHFGLYGILTFLLARTYQADDIFKFVVIFLFSLFYGGLMEILQSAIAVNRSGSWADLLADLFGAVIGLLLYRWINRGSEINEGTAKRGYG